MLPAVTITPVHVADFFVSADPMPVYVHVIDHPQGRVLVDTGFGEVHPAIEDMDPLVVPVEARAWDPTSVDLVVNTHLHFDHCGGNALFPGVPTYVQRRELEEARTLEDYTIREWVDAPGVTYVEVDGEHELLPGVRLLPAPGHTNGTQVVAVDTVEGLVIIAGDAAVWAGELDEPTTEGQRLIVGRRPAAVWMSHAHEPWRPAA